MKFIFLMLALISSFSIFAQEPSAVYTCQIQLLQKGSKIEVLKSTSVVVIQDTMTKVEAELDGLTCSTKAVNYSGVEVVDGISVKLPDGTLIEDTQAQSETRLFIYIKNYKNKNLKCVCNKGSQEEGANSL